jgi:ornithine cyclodeaminase/alanine dehydrogenase
MAIFINDQEVNQLLDMPSCVDALEEAFRQRGLGEAMNLPRRRIPFAGRQLHLMPASVPGIGYAGFKAYGLGQGQDVVLYAPGEGLVAIIRSGRLGQVRTGAASGVATKFMARADASTVGCIGTGRQAETQLEAVAHVRKLTSVAVYSRDPERRSRFAQKMTSLLEQEVRPVATAQEAVKDRDIVIAITTAQDAVFDGNDLAPGTHINAAGANVQTHRELDDTTIGRADIIAADDVEQARIEYADLIQPITRGVIFWEKVYELSHIVAGIAPGRRSPEEITLFKSGGLALEDVAAARVIYERARERALGTPLPF